MAPPGRDIEEWPKHERPFFDPGMRQNERPWARPGESRMPSPPMPHEPFVVENIDIECPGTPRAAASAPCMSLDPLQEPQQRLP